MKSSIIAISVVIAAVATATSGQVKSVTAAGYPPESKTPARQAAAETTRTRLTGNDIKVASLERARLRRTTDSTDISKPRAAIESNSFSPSSTSALQPSGLFSTFVPVSMASTQIYRVGRNDVLDIQIEGNSEKRSTLFTVGADGLLEYPLAGDPIAVAGLTPAEITTLLSARIRIFEKPGVVVTVRDYASHAVTVSGFVAAPGRKILRREAVPLYALLAEAMVLPEAGRATITREGRTPIVADLKDPIHASTLVITGDVIRVSGVPAGPGEFFFVGGAISSPGQKPFHEGLTLTQALLASGGTTVKSEARIRISRLGPNSRLVIEDHNLRKIQTGRLPDPVLQNGDRIEVIPVK